MLGGGGGVENSYFVNQRFGGLDSLSHIIKLNGAPCTAITANPTICLMQTTSPTTANPTAFALPEKMFAYRF